MAMAPLADLVSLQVALAQPGVTDERLRQWVQLGDLEAFHDHDGHIQVSLGQLAELREALQEPPAAPQAPQSSTWSPDAPAQVLTIDQAQSRLGRLGSKIDRLAQAGRLTLLRGPDGRPRLLADQVDALAAWARDAEARALSAELSLAAPRQEG